MQPLAAIRASPHPTGSACQWQGSCRLLQKNRIVLSQLPDIIQKIQVLCLFQKSEKQLAARIDRPNLAILRMHPDEALIIRQGLILLQQVLVIEFGRAAHHRQDPHPARRRTHIDDPEVGRRLLRASSQVGVLTN